MHAIKDHEILLIYHERISDQSLGFDGISEGVDQCLDDFFVDLQHSNVD
jgi:hypothetical protein